MVEKLTLKKVKKCTENNSLAYIYIYCRVNIGPMFAVFESNFGPRFLICFLFVFFHKSPLSARRMRFQKQDDKNYHF